MAQSENETGSGNEHDELFRILMKDKKRTNAFIRACLPKKLAARLASAPARRMDSVFVSGARCDALFEMTTRSGEPLLVLFEHKSWRDAGAPLQIMRYVNSAWDLYAEGKAARLRNLPTIAVIVLYHGDQPWNLPPFTSFIGDAESQWVTLDLSALGDADLRRQFRGPGIRAILTAFKHLRRRQKVKPKILETILKDLPKSLRNPVMLYILEVADINRAKLLAALKQATPGREDDVMGTFWEEATAVGRRKGKQEGRQEGESQALTRLLQKRFGPLPDAAQARIAAASEDQLHAWFDAAIDSESLPDGIAG